MRPVVDDIILTAAAQAAASAGRRVAADRRGRGHRRARQRPEEHCRDDIDKCKPAREGADYGLGEIDDPPGDPAAIHDLAREDEKRDRQENERIGVGDDLGHGGHRASKTQGQDHRGQSAEGDAEGDGYPQRQERGEDNDQNEYGRRLHQISFAIRRPLRMKRCVQ